VHESRILWSDAKPPGRISEENWLVPGSSIKGAISHRVAFHYNRLVQNWADDIAVEDPGSLDEAKTALTKLTGENCPAVQELFGFQRGSQETDSDSGRKGIVAMDDIFIEFEKSKANPGYLNHTSIDRFTGGVRGSFLFSERALYGGSFAGELRITLFLEGTQLAPKTKAALAWALKDLAEGRLALGGGKGRGHGFMKASFDDQTMHWIENSIHPEGTELAGTPSGNGGQHDE
jgi:CRISPR/Cas system CSM-associated protein Csm3 (group 7 of RAMP superfamily)